MSATTTLVTVNEMLGRRTRLVRYTRQVCCLTPFPVLAAATITLVGCAGSAPASPRAGTPIPAPEVVVSDSAKPRFPPRFIYQPGQLRYRLQVSSTVQLMAGDSVQRSDSTRVTGNFNVVLSSVPGRDRIAAQIQPDSISLTAGSGTSVSTAPAAPITFQINQPTGRATVDKATQNSTCDQDAQHSPFSGSEVLPNIQPQFVTSWVDTSTTTTCRGGVLLTLRRVATYTPLDTADNTYRILRSTQLTVNGVGHQWNQQVNVRGEGAATDTLYLSGSPLRLQQMTGGSYLRLQFQAPLKTQDFSQNTTTNVLLQRP
jgi:hypothetical protein